MPLSKQVSHQPNESYNYGKALAHNGRKLRLLQYLDGLNISCDAEWSNH
jgi:hypothetical protein